VINLKIQTKGVLIIRFSSLKSLAIYIINYVNGSPFFKPWKKETKKETGIVHQCESLKMGRKAVWSKSKRLGYKQIIIKEKGVFIKFKIHYNPAGIRVYFL
jgi:hypothetical protein